MSVSISVVHRFLYYFRFKVKSGQECFFLFLVSFFFLVIWFVFMVLLLDLVFSFTFTHEITLNSVSGEKHELPEET